MTSVYPELPTWLALADRQRERSQMVIDQLLPRGIRNAQVLQAMGAIPRHLFVPEPYQSQAYDDYPLAIGCEQTISQPFVVAAMTELVAPAPSHTVPEVGTGSGYQAAVLAALVGRLYTMEIVPELAAQAAWTLGRLGLLNTTVVTGDGYDGLPEHAPFDAIVVTAAPKEVPSPLLAQLKVGGRLAIPVGDSFQELRLITRTPTGFNELRAFDVRFVPMTGKAQQLPSQC